ncbi:MAG: ribonuclease R [Erythrobacter sp.]
MAKRPNRRPPGLPSRGEVLEFIQTADGATGKREIARAFGIKGQEKIALKRLLKDMAEEGLIDGKKTAYHRMGGVPKVTVLKVIEIEDGEAIAVPENWAPDAPEGPPRLTMKEQQGKGRGHGRGAKSMPALKRGDRVLSRTEERDSGWVAFPMKKLPARSEGLMGVVELDGSGKPWLAPVDKKIRSSAPITDLGEAEAGQLVFAERAGRSERSGVKITEIVGDPLAPKSFSLIAIAKHGIPHTFPDDTLEEAQLVTELDLSSDDREDLRQLPIVAIDPADARDHDDAIWAKPDGKGGFDAVVAIADVSFYVRPGGALDKEARKRGNSVYFPDRVVPMLPEILSADVCSLREGEDRAAMVCHMHIDGEGKIGQTRFTRAIVRIHHNIAYEDAQAAVDQGNPPEFLTHLWAAWAKLAQARAARDPLELELPERRVVLDEQGQIAEIAVRERLDAHRVVEDFMIAANVAAAKALEAKKSPVVYRVHETPSREKLITLRDYMETFGRKLSLGQVITPSIFNSMLKDVESEDEKAQIMEAVLRSQMQAFYGPVNSGHFGLGLGSYAHFTSPIRRYADLLVHRSLVDAYRLEQPEPRVDCPASTGLSDRDKEALSQITDAISQTERRAMEAERDTIDRYVAAWLSNRVGKNFETRITGVQSFGFFATIVGLGGDGLVPVSTLGSEYFRYEEAAQALVGENSGTRYAPGDKLTLQLAEANALTGALKFVLVDTDGAAIEPRGNRRSDRRNKPEYKKGGKFTAGKRGRPGNIRHQGRGKKR